MLHDTVVRGRDGTHPVPGGIGVYMNSVELHMEKSVWGDDAPEFRPSRWLSKGGKPGEEGLIMPPRGSFIPWSGRPQTCPGQKMSQVELVSAMATLFGLCRAEPAPVEGLADKQLRQRLVDLMEDSQPKVTMQINRPRYVVLKWSARE